jgi:hypothetical protein
VFASESIRILRTPVRAPSVKTCLHRRDARTPIATSATALIGTRRPVLGGLINEYERVA